MEKLEPKFRCGTGEAIRELAKELALPYDEEMQDWSYEVAKTNEIERYLQYYDKQKDDDKRFVLMEMIIQAVNDQPNHNLFNHYWDETKKKLQTDFSLHEYTVYYWALFSNEPNPGMWKITPNMQQLWHDIKTDLN